MLAQIDINKHNFSKIGKYISNKLHHIHNHKSSKSIPSSSEHFSKFSKDKVRNQQKQHTSRHPIKKDHHWYEPSVGSYRVNFSAIDKNVHQYNFNRSTPHFYGLKYKANQMTPLLKDFPEQISPKQTGFTELGRMVGREEIKGCIRKNMENPHQQRFQIHQFSNLTYRSNGVSFEKMSPRKDIINHHKKNGAEYDYNYQIKLKRLDSHIIPFKKQTSRPQVLHQQVVSSSEDYRYDQEQIKNSVDKSVAWSKQLSREAEGMLPSYMEKTVTSRMAISHLNLKTLEMNCSDLKQNKKLLKRRFDAKNVTNLQSQKMYER